MIIEQFSDFQCIHCLNFYNETEAELVTRFVETGEVYYVFRSFGGFLGDESLAAAEAMYCAGDQEMHVGDLALGVSLEQVGIQETPQGSNNLRLAALILRHVQVDTRNLPPVGVDQNADHEQDDVGDRTRHVPGCLHDYLISTCSASSP